MHFDDSLSGLSDRVVHTIHFKTCLHVSPLWVVSSSAFMSSVWPCSFYRQLRFVTAVHSIILECQEQESTTRKK